MDNVIYQELERIRIQYGGMLKPEYVEKEARDPKNPLHKRFEWDDKKAGYQYRLYQARQLIRVSIVFIGDDDDEPIKAYWSYMDDRTNRNGGGYTAMIDILQDDERYQSMLMEAKKELDVFRKKYKMIKELQGLIGLINDYLGSK
jgi:hypothetical protein